MTFTAPVADIAFWLRAVTSVEADIAAGVFPDLTSDLIDAILLEAGRFAADEIAPLNQPGDVHGARLENGAVILPPGWHDVFARWVNGGWTSLAASPAYDGQGLPLLLQTATQEIWNAANPAFAIGPLLTAGAIEALEAHGSDEQKRLYLPKLIAGTWTGTMNLTEPQAGSDLGALRTRAEPADDGSFRIFGSKIYITYGEHDLAENIIHLVLARLPDAPAGSRGISLFLVPKFIPDAAGNPGHRNDLRAARLEHKLGLHASPTCEMQFGEGEGAVGWLVGAPHRGLAAMFTMMNNARLAVGVQGVGVAERATQRALNFALERKQGRAPGHTGPDMSPIIHHPDVKRMLLTMRALTDVSRAVCFALAHAIDLSRHGPEATRAAFADRAALLTPVAKAFSTDTGVDVASLGIQVHGGMGYIEETGAAQHLRDARIFPIYEGTNGIQAIDLVTRKLTLQGGATVAAYLAELRAAIASAPDVAPATAALDDLAAATAWLQRALAENRQADALAGAMAYLRLFALAAGGAYHLMAVEADRAAGTTTTAATRRALVARHYAAVHLPETAALRLAATAGASVLDAATSAILTA